MNTYSEQATQSMFSVIVSAFSDSIASMSVWEQSAAYGEQKDTKPAIEDVICRHLDGSTLKNALSFIGYIRASKMKIKWSAVNVWSVRYRNKHVLDIIVSQDTWRVRLAYDHIRDRGILTVKDQESIKELVGALRNAAPSGIETIPAMS